MRFFEELLLIVSIGVSHEGLKFKRIKNGIVYKIDKIILPSALELSRACFKEETEDV